MFPAIVEAMLDSRLHRRDLTVYGAALEVLDFRDFRSWKKLAASHRTGMREQHVRRSMSRLAALGYLEAAPYDPGADGRNPRQYRLLFSPRGPQVGPVRAA